MEVHTMLAMLDPNEFIFLRFGSAMAEGYAEYELGDQVVRIFSDARWVMLIRGAEHCRGRGLLSCRKPYERIIGYFR
jgi:hypothetical protein